MPSFSIVLLLALSTLLCGCPYESGVPLEQTSSVTINDDLLGSWHKSNYPSDLTTITFEKRNETEYIIKAIISNKKKEYTHYFFTGFFSNVKDGMMLNVKNDKGKYYIVAVWLEDGRLSLKALSKEITTKKFNSPDEIRNFVETIYSNGTVKYDSDTELNDLQKTD